MTTSYYLSRPCPLDTWQLVTEPPADGELIELDVQFYGQAIAERDKRNGKGNVDQGVLGL